MTNLEKWPKRGGFEVKSVVSSFSMSLSQAQRLADATKRVKNRSAWIVGAIEAKILEADAFSLSDVPDNQLTLHAHARWCTDCDMATATMIQIRTCPNYLILARMAEKKRESGD